MKFRPGDYFKVINGVGIAHGCVLGIKHTGKVGQPISTIYSVCWAHTPDGNVCDYPADKCDSIWEPSTESDFLLAATGPMTITLPPPTPGKSFTIKLPAGTTIKASAGTGGSTPKDEGVVFRIPEVVSRMALGLECDHNLVPYVGAREAYKFCTKCDHKQEIPK